MKSYFSYLEREYGWPNLGLVLTYDRVRYGQVLGWWGSDGGEVIVAVGRSRFSSWDFSAGILTHVSVLYEPLE